MHELTPGSVVLLHALDDIPEHLFRVDEVFEDCVTGYSRTGPLAGEDHRFERPGVLRVPTVAETARTYLNRRSNQLRPGGLKSVHYSVGLFASKYRDLRLDQLERSHGKAFLSAVSRLSLLLGKFEETRGLSLQASLARSRGIPITVRTQKRIWSQLRHYVASTVYEGHLEKLLSGRCVSIAPTMETTIQIPAASAENASCDLPLQVDSELPGTRVVSRP